VAELPIIGTQVTERWLQLERLGAGWTAELQPYLDTGLDWLLSLGVRLGEAILQVSLSVLVAFFFFRDGAEGARRLDAAVKRLAGDRAQQLLAVAGGTVRSVVYGVIGTALAQATLQGLGLWLAGVARRVLPGLPDLLPVLHARGTALGLAPGSRLAPVQRHDRLGHIFLIGWGFLVVSGVDNVLRPYLISRGSRLPLILMFFGVLGGLLAFGFLGVFLGPTLLAIGYVLFQEWSSAPRSATNEGSRRGGADASGTAACC
jgi:predicted PurR-regulated permease PerM